MGFCSIKRGITLTWCLLSFHHTKIPPKEKVASCEQDDKMQFIHGSKITGVPKKKRSSAVHSETTDVAKHAVQLRRSTTRGGTPRP
jgi:hypothetical protein